MNYEEMSDFEINKWIWRQTKSPKTMYVSSEYQRVFHDAYEIHEFDPCNNPSDAWSIMNECRIEIRRDTCQAHVSSYFNPEFVIHCKNDEFEILRAAMICFLLMKDAENDNRSAN